VTTARVRLPGNRLWQDSTLYAVSAHVTHSTGAGRGPPFVGLSGSNYPVYHSFYSPYLYTICTHTAACICPPLLVVLPVR